MKNSVRVRFAPSPTGYLHVGGARTALFNWLFARHHGGKLILRIEDTDLSRSSDEMVEGILEGMRWLGLAWDEGPFFQSQRFERYRVFTAELLEKGLAYRCFCRPDSPAAADANGEIPSWSYDRRCRALEPSEARRRAEAGEPCAARFRVPEGKTAYRDQVYGDIEVENEQVEDFVLLRSDGMPTYHLGVVVDDLDMQITHVIRGADHISNTPKQVLLYRAADKPLPEFAHLPLILGPDKQRLSKRHGATSVMAYSEMGYLPEAFFNFLALLGWSPGDDRELLSRDELISLFSLERVGKANAVFGIDKLDWFNSQYLTRCDTATLGGIVSRELYAAGVWRDSTEALPEEGMHRTLELLKPRARKIGDFSGRFRAFFTDDFSYDEAAAAKFLSDSRLRGFVRSLIERYREDDQFTLGSTEKHLRGLAEREGVKPALLMHALRVGLTGQGVAPGLFDVMVTLGRSRTLNRLERLCSRLAGKNGE